MFIEIVLGLVVVGLMGVIIGMAIRRSPNEAGQQSTMLVKQDIERLSRDIAALNNGVQTHLGSNAAMMQSAIQKQFAASSKLITDVTERLTKLDDTNKRVVDVADELKVLQNVLQNPKQRGVLGEYYLDQVLKNVLPPDRYKLQYKLGKNDSGQELICDAVVVLDKDKLLPIDSKFSLENYNRLIEAKDKTERESYVRAFKADLKGRIDETAKYIRPKQGTMDYAFMFIPSEAIYYDLLVNKVGVTTVSGVGSRDLIEYAFREKNVIIVSPTTFMAYLQTVMQGLRALQIEEQAKEIQQRVGELGRHLSVYEQYMQKLGGSLGTTVNHYNNAHKELKKIDKDVLKVAQTSAGVEPILLDRPESSD